MLKSLLIALLLILPLWAGATTYYVDNCVLVGNDSNGGSDPSAPWLTIAHVNAQSFQPGDSVLFERTCVWREQLIVPSAGTSGNQITFGAYGAGADPLINGSGLVSGWTPYAKNVYQASISSYAGTPSKVWFNGTLGTPKTSIGALTGKNEWYWEPTTLYIYSSSNPTTAYTGPGIEAALFEGVLVQRSYITVNGIDTMKGNVGVAVTATANLSSVDVLNGTHFNNGTNGIAYATYNGNSISGGTIQGNTIHDNGACGINITAANSLLVQNNTIYSNGAVLQGCSGIYEYHSSTGANIYQYNAIYSNVMTGSYGGNGIHLDQVFDDEIVRYNLIYSNARVGVLEESNHASSDATGPQIYGNVVYSNGISGIYKQCRSGSDTSGATWRASRIYNNTIYGNEWNIVVAGDGIATCSNNQLINNISSGSTRYNLLAYNGGDNNGTNGSGNIYTYNCFGPETSTFIQWGLDSKLATYAAFDTAYGASSGVSGATHSVAGDPKFTNAGGDNFTLSSTSPCIGAGKNLSTTYEMGLDSLTSFPWGTLNRSGQTSGWDIGAFVFVQRIAPAPPTSLSAIVN